MWNLRNYCNKYHGLDQHSVSIMYNGMIKPLMLYSLQSWFTNNKHAKHLNKLHNEAASVCSGYHRNCDNNLMFIELNWFSLKFHHIKYSLMFTHRCATHEHHHRIKHQFFDMLTNNILRNKSKFWKFVIPYIFSLVEFLDIHIDTLWSLKPQQFKNLVLKYIVHKEYRVA